jgi:YVTN family beta-propeller protein
MALRCEHGKGFSGLDGWALRALCTASCALLACSSSASDAGRDGGGEAAAGPPGTIYVTMYGDDEITAFDQPTFAVLSHIKVGKGPAILLATADGKKLYTANWLDNTISVVDVAAGSSQPIALDGRPWAISMSPDGATLYAGLASNKVVAIATSTDTIVRSLDTSPNFPQSVAVSADGKTLYVDPASTSTYLSPGALEAIDAMTGAVVHASIPVGVSPAFASVSPDGSLVYTLNFVPGSVSIVDTASWQVTATLSLGSGSQPIISTNTPNGLLAVTNFGSGDMVTVAWGTTTVAHTVALDGRPVGVGGFNKAGTLGYICDFGHGSLGVQESLQALQSFQNGDFSAFLQGPGHLTTFNPMTGAKIGTPLTVGKGPTSVVVLAP